MPTWTAHPRAAVLLASCAARPPQWRYETHRGLVHDVTVAEFFGHRVDELKAIREAWIDEHSGCDWSGDVSREAGTRWFDMHETQPSVDAAVQRAVDAGSRQQVAA